MTVEFFRGDDRAPSDPVLRSQGFTPKGIPERDGKAARKFLRDQFSDGSINTPNDLGFRWRIQPPGGLIATSMTQDGAYTQTHYFYKITIPDNELTFRRYLRNGEIGAIVPNDSVLSQWDYLIMHNKESYEQADIIALYHGRTNSKEVTFITSIPANYISGFRNGSNTGRNDVPFAAFHKPIGFPR